MKLVLLRTVARPLRVLFSSSRVAVVAKHIKFQVVFDDFTRKKQHYISLRLPNTAAQHSDCAALRGRLTVCKGVSSVYYQEASKPHTVLTEKRSLFEFF